MDCTVIDCFWPFDDRECCSIGVCATDCLDDSMVDDLVTVDQQKRSLRTITRLKKRVSTAKLVGLCVW